MGILSSIKSSIIKKLTLSYFTIIMILLIVGGLTINFYIQQSIKKDFFWLIENQVKQMEQNILEKIDSCKQSTNTIRWDKNLINILQSVDNTDQSRVDTLINNIIPQLESIKVHNRNIYKITVVHSNTQLQNAAGLVIYDPGFQDGTWEKKFKDLRPGSQGIYEDMYIESIHIEKSYLSSNALGKYKILSLYRPIYGSLNKMIGVIKIDMLESIVLDTLINNEKMQFSINSLVTNEASELYSSKPGFKGVTKQELHNSESFFSFTSDSNKYYVAKAYVEEISNWIVLYTPEKLFNLSNSYKLTIIGVILGTAIMLYFLEFFLIRGILGKLTNLTTAMDRVKRGDLDTICKISGSDEVDNLSQNFNEMVKRIKGLLDKLKEANILEQEAIYNSLANQMNPHFMCNALDMVRLTSEINNKPEISQMIVKIMNLFVYNVSIKQKYVTLVDELKNATGYLEIYNLMTKARIDLDINVCSELSGILDQYLIIKFTLQPLVENCINHAFEKTTNNCFIFIDIRRKGDYIYIMIEDNGVGISELRMNELKEYLDLNKRDYRLETKGNGIGLRNIIERIYMNYGFTNGLEIESSYGIGSCVTLKIPVIKK